LTNKELMIKTVLMYTLFNRELSINYMS